MLHQIKGKLGKDFKKVNDLYYVALVGSRHVNDIDFVFEAFNNKFQNRFKNLVIVSGGFEGVDSIARQIALTYDIPIIEILPDYHKYGTKACDIMNHEIIKIVDFVLAIPSKTSIGTWALIKLAKKHNIPYEIVPYGCC